MGRRPIHRVVIARIQQLHEEHPDWKGVELHNYLEETFPTSQREWKAKSVDIGECPSIRKVQQVVSDERRRMPVPRYVAPDEPLTPWRSKDWLNAGPEGIACLYRLLKTAADAGRVMNEREAKWALRLREVLGDTNEEQRRLHLQIASSYSERERISETFDRPIHTSDFDIAMSYRPWESRRNKANYQEMLGVRKTAGRVSFNPERGIPDWLWGFQHEEEAQNARER